MVSIDHWHYSIAEFKYKGQFYFRLKKNVLSSYFCRNFRISKTFYNSVSQSENSPPYPPKATAAKTPRTKEKRICHPKRTADPFDDSVVKSIGNDSVPDIAVGLRLSFNMIAAGYEIAAEVVVARGRIVVDERAAGDGDRAVVVRADDRIRHAIVVIRAEAVGLMVDLRRAQRKVEADERRNIVDGIGFVADRFGHYVDEICGIARKFAADLTERRRRYTMNSIARESA